MAALPPKQIVTAIEDAFAETGASAVLISNERAHPRRFYIVAGESSFPVWIYIWTLTHGGGAARPRDEYRIQLTGVTPPLPQNPDGPTLLLGYEQNTKCFAGFDLRMHRAFSRKSPSIQVNINTLRNAVRDGFAFARKGNDEIAIGFRPDNILAYTLNAENLHESGADARVSDALNKVTRFETLTEVEANAIPAERQRVIAKVSRLARDSDFRRKVTVAYDRKCAVTGLQLRLIDAAHILPVGADGSTDEVSNGICLSPTYHRAYDRGLIFLTDDLRMMINTPKRRDLVRLGLGGGLAEFEAPLGREVFLPPDRRQWPNTDYIHAANAVRAS
ncbi:MAG: HNH endonuclease [Kiritimatiellae bacterium]|nr:HNH endonuclease [Kiritimatiellia bacterium]